MIPKEISTKELASLLYPDSTRNAHVKNKKPRFALFLGAGASKESWIKDANQMIAHFVDEICKGECPEITEPEERDKWLKTNNYYTDERDKYRALFEIVYETQFSRREYIDSLIDGKLPSLGYIALAQLIKNEIVDTIITTNFDDLIYQACTNYTDIRPTVFSLGNFASEIISTVNRPRILKMHGDYMFSRLINISEEYKNVDPNMTKEIHKVLETYQGLVIIGYAGNDKSVLRMLESVSPEKYIFWCTYKDTPLNYEVAELLSEKHRYKVKTDGFDDLMIEICKLCDIGHEKIVSSASNRAVYLYEEFLKFSANRIDALSAEDPKQKTSLQRQRGKIDDRFGILYYFVLGNAAYLSGNYTQAAEYYQAAIQYKKTEADTYYNYAKALSEIEEQFDKAEEAFKEALHLNEKDPYTHNRYANLLAQETSRYKEAAEHYQRAIELKDDYSFAYYGYGTLLFRSNKINDSETNFKRAVEFFEKTDENNLIFFKSLISLASIYIKQNNKVEEEYYFQKASIMLSKIKDNYALACYGSVIRDKGIVIEYLEEAISNKPFLKNIARLDPNFEWIRNNSEFKKIVSQ